MEQPTGYAQRGPTDRYGNPRRPVQPPNFTACPTTPAFVNQMKVERAAHPGRGIAANRGQTRAPNRGPSRGPTRNQQEYIGHYQGDHQGGPHDDNRVFQEQQLPRKLRPTKYNKNKLAKMQLEGASSGPTMQFNGPRQQARTQMVPTTAIDQRITLEAGANEVVTVSSQADRPKQKNPPNPPAKKKKVNEAAQERKRKREEKLAKMKEKNIPKSAEKVVYKDLLARMETSKVTMYAAVNKSKPRGLISIFACWPKGINALLSQDDSQSDKSEVVSESKQEQKPESTHLPPDLPTPESTPESTPILIEQLIQKIATYRIITSAYIHVIDKALGSDEKLDSYIASFVELCESTAPVIATIVNRSPVTVKYQYVDANVDGNIRLIDIDV